MTARRIKSLKYAVQKTGGYIHREHRSKKGRIKYGVGKYSKEASILRKKKIEDIKLQELENNYD